MNQLSSAPDVGCVYIQQADYELPVKRASFGLSLLEQIRLSVRELSLDCAIDFKL
jgi:hypothetical protein